MPATSVTLSLLEKSQLYLPLSIEPSQNHQSTALKKRYVSQQTMSCMPNCSTLLVMLNLSDLACQIFRHKYIPRYKVSVDNALARQVVHTHAHLPTEAEQCDRKVLRYGSRQIALCPEVMIQIPSMHKLQHKHQLQKFTKHFFCYVVMVAHLQYWIDPLFKMADQKYLPKQSLYPSQGFIKKVIQGGGHDG